MKSAVVATVEESQCTGRMMRETAQRFLEHDMHSFILFADLGNPTLAFYDRLGGERLFDDRGQLNGGYAWRDVRTLLE